MYSLVLMTALTGSAAETPNWYLSGFRGSCNGAVGLLGWRWGYGCGGSCSGCSGSCNGSCSGCSGSCAGCSGSCAGGSTSCGGASASCCGCGASVGGGMSYASSAVWGANYTYTNTYPGMPPTTKPGSLSEPIGPPRKEKTSASDTAARLHIEVPPGAKLYIDGQLMPGQSEVRHFTTPPLEIGEKYYYEVRVEVPMKDGPPVTETSKLTVTAGENKTPSFAHLGRSVQLAATK